MEMVILQKHHMYNKAFIIENPRSNGSLYGTFPCEYYTDDLQNSNIATNHPEAIPSRKAKGTIYEGNLVSSVIIEQTILQSALSSIETFDGTRGKFKVWTGSVENAAQISGQDTLYIEFLGSLLSSANRLKAQ